VGCLILRRCGRVRSSEGREFITLLGRKVTWLLEPLAQHLDRVRWIDVLTGFAESDPLR
jgi:hypothetical protein